MPRDNKVTLTGMIRTEKYAHTWKLFFVDSQTREIHNKQFATPVVNSSHFDKF